ncbi:MAG: phosphoserine phosphatase SerB [Alphaproteobacteria bacterium]|nr:phosphoserine phosphatase SerB [Alphaproteobacteria bacterium]MBO6627398.1 phosphoserine phosphatase SerB [Alphaproteobacteria bacterium]MDF1626970.1 phosphoserine phosphatase SerB [Parvibaculaceae bacterium]
MSYVLTLIGNQNTDLTEDVVTSVASALKLETQPIWLKTDHACDLLVADGERNQILNIARQALDATSIDMVFQPIAGRRKKLLIADMDSTIIEQECIDELAESLGLRSAISEITERAMRGELEFEAALRERVSLLKGLSEEELQKVYDNQITETPGGRALCATMRKHGATCALVSGGFTFFTSRVAAAVGFQSNQANTLLIENGSLTGKVSDPILGREAKRQALHAFARDLGLAPIDTMAVGDGANDLAMIGDAGLGVAFHAKPVVAEAAAAQVNHGDLSALLYIQGYRADDITETL